MNELIFILPLLVESLVFVKLFHEKIKLFSQTITGKITFSIFGDVVYVIGGGVLGNVATSYFANGWARDMFHGIVAGVTFVVCGAVLREFFKKRG